MPMSMMTSTAPFLNLSSARVRVSTNQLHFRLLPPTPSLVSTTIRMGGGPRTFPGGVSKWQWKRMQAKKAKQLLKARLCRERQMYEMRKRAELRAAVSELERPWEVVERAAPTLFSVKADEQLKVLADRFQRPGGYDLWSERDGPQLFRTPDGLPTARFFPKGAVHSIKPYGRVGSEDEEDGSRDLNQRGRNSRVRRRRSDRRGLEGSDVDVSDDIRIWNGRVERGAEDVYPLEEDIIDIKIEEPNVGVSNRRPADSTKIKHNTGSYDRPGRRVVVGRRNSVTETNFGGGRDGRAASSYSGSRNRGNRSRHGAKDLLDELDLKRTVDEEKRGRVPLNGYRGDDRRFNAGKPKDRRTQHVYGMNSKQDVGDIF